MKSIMDLDMEHLWGGGELRQGHFVHLKESNGKAS